MSVEADVVMEPAAVPPAHRTAPAVIRKAAVLGAGTMGSRIAAHLANAGLPVVLLDLPAKEAARSSIAAQALEALKKTKPAAFFDPALAARVSAGNFEDDLALLADCDWVIEAVTENLAIKQALLEKVVPHLKPGAFMTTNTSGLSIASIAAGLAGGAPALFRHPLLQPAALHAPGGDHPHARNRPSRHRRRRAFRRFCLGKEVVFARDTPNFIANRIGVFIMLEAVRLMQERRPHHRRSGRAYGSSHRLAAHRHLPAGGPGGHRCAGPRGRQLRRFGRDAVPPFRSSRPCSSGAGWATKPARVSTAGSRTPQARKSASCWIGKRSNTFPPRKAQVCLRSKWPKTPRRLPGRLAQLLTGDVRKDKAARFHWRLLTALWNYAADCLPEIADDAASVDRAMRSGFNWEMGPFQLWDAAGLPGTAARMQLAGERVSPIAERLSDAGAHSWYRNGGRECFDVDTRTYRPVAEPEGVARIATFRSSHGVVRHNPGASLVDLADGVACLELHSKKNAVGEDIVRLVTETCSPASDAVRNFEAFVISGDAEHFSVGANLMQLLLSAQEGEWDEIDFAVRAFQRMTAAIKFCPRPVVVAPYSASASAAARRLPSMAPCARRTLNCIWGWWRPVSA